MHSHIAIHEAGHALIAWYYGFRLDKVTLSPSPGKYLGACFASCGRVDFAGMPLTLSAHSVYVKFAGRIATELYCPGHEGGYDLDFNDVVAMMPEDRETLKMHSFDCRKGSIEDFFHRFNGPAVRILKSKKGKKALMALTSELVKSGTLSGAAVADIFEKNWGKPLPRKAIPVDGHLAVLNQRPKSYTGLMQELVSLTQLMQHDIDSLKWQLNDDDWGKLHKIKLYLSFLEIEIDRVKGQHP